ncbi:MAG: DUF4923 family protein [Paraprevotella sp.]|nr:DUF4923 family protein [Paraprevotella sp.]
MKKLLKSSFVIAVAIMLCGCGGQTTSTATSPQSNSLGSSSQIGGVLNSLLGSLIGNSTSLTQADLIGTWTYKGPECRFESSNFLQQAGGEIAANKIESKLAEVFAKIGVKADGSQYSFTEDGTFKFNIASRTLSATYTFNPETRAIIFTDPFGIFNTEATVCKSGNELSILFDANKLMSIANTIGALTNNETLKSATSLLNSYEGIKVGFSMTK